MSLQAALGTRGSALIRCRRSTSRHFYCGYLLFMVWCWSYICTSQGVCACLCLHYIRGETYSPSDADTAGVMQLWFFKLEHELRDSISLCLSPLSLHLDCLWRSMKSLPSRIGLQPQGSTKMERTLYARSPSPPTQQWKTVECGTLSSKRTTYTASLTPERKRCCINVPAFA
jgi:hypothetical protein